MCAQNRFVTLCIIGLFLAAGFPCASIYADAYLSEDSIYYSADRYDIDYGQKIITAVGDALFRRENITVRSDKAVIHYEKGEKKAYFYGDVNIENSADGYTVGGRYGEVHYEKRYAFVEGDSYYRDDTRVIHADRIDAAEDGDRRFNGEVIFREGDVRIDSESLIVHGEESAVFSGDCRIEFEDTGDRLFCGEVVQNLATGVSQFSGEAVYVEAPDGGEEARSPFVIRAEVMRYHPDSESFLCLDDVRAVNEEYTLIAPVLRYHRRQDLMTTEGETIVRSGTGTVYCTQLNFDVASGKAEFLGSVQGFVADSQGDTR